MSRQLLVVSGVTLLLVGTSLVSAQNAQPPSATNSAAPKQIYTCPMHPEIQWTRADKCPICEMKLVAKGAETAGTGNAMHDHAGMAMPAGEMGSMMRGCGCSMCMEMMGMGNMNGSMSKAVSPVKPAGRPMYRSYSPRAGSGRCGC